jgi:putative FmdB family regulatory protein
MPIFEFECSKCETRFERIVRIPTREVDFSDCPDEGCDGIGERVFSVSHPRFKGEGFYVNDYPKGSNNQS